MVQSGINPAHQPPGIKSSISWPQNIPQEPVSQGCSSYVGQLHGSSLSQQQRRHPLSSSDVLSSGNLDMVSSEKRLNFSTACSWKRKYYSRLRVSYLPWLNRLATRSNGNLSLPYKLQHGSFCQPPNSTATPICKLATRSRSISYRRSNTSLEVSDGLCFSPPPPPFNLIPVVLNKVIQDIADLLLVAPIWQAQPWWPILLSPLVSNPVLLPRSQHLMRISQIQARYMQCSLAFIWPCVESPAVLSNRRLSWTGYQTAPLSNSVFHSKGLRISMVLLESLVC